ncbi:hypothetical protein [Salinigranum sp. GCM10025319]
MRPFVHPAVRRVVAVASDPFVVGVDDHDTRVFGQRFFSRAGRERA